MSLPHIVGTLFRTSVVSSFTLTQVKSRPISDHFDGKRFRNQTGLRPRGFRDIVRWQLTSEPSPWPEWMTDPWWPPPPSVVAGPRLWITWINHCTFLLQTSGVNILIDPIWSQRASPFQWAGPKRHRDPGVRWHDLPAIHFVLISHNHYDHLDLPTLRRLASDHRPRFVTTIGNARVIAKAGLTDGVELDWWEDTRISDDLQVTSVPAAHFSGRSLTDRNRALWCGFVLHTPGGPVYYSGDTGWGPHFAAIRYRFGPPRLALLPAGAYEPRWFMGPVHMAPGEMVKAVTLLEPKAVIPMHYGTFALGDEGPREGVDIAKTVLSVKQRARFFPLSPGEGMEIPPLVAG